MTRITFIKELQSNIQQGNKLVAIRDVKNIINNWSLRECKEYMDKYYNPLDAFHSAINFYNNLSDDQRNKIKSYNSKLIINH